MQKFTRDPLAKLGCVERKVLSLDLADPWQQKTRSYSRTAFVTTYFTSKATDPKHDAIIASIEFPETFLEIILVMVSAVSNPNGVEDEKHQASLPGYLRSTTAQENRVHTLAMRAAAASKENSPVDVKKEKQKRSTPKFSQHKLVPSPFIYSKAITSPFPRLQKGDVPQAVGSQTAKAVSPIVDPAAPVQSTTRARANTLGPKHSIAETTRSSPAKPQAFTGARPRRNTAHTYTPRRLHFQNQTPSSTDKPLKSSNPIAANGVVENPNINSLDHLFQDTQSSAEMTRHGLDAAAQDSNPTPAAADAALDSDVDDAAHEKYTAAYYLAARNAAREDCEQEHSAAGNQLAALPPPPALHSAPSTDTTALCSSLSKRNQELAAACARQHEQLDTIRNKFEHSQKRLASETQVVFEFSNLLDEAETHAHRAEGEKAKLKEMLAANQSRCQQFFNEATAAKESCRRLENDIKGLQDTINDMQKRDESHRKRDDERSLANVKTISELKAEAHRLSMDKTLLETMVNQRSGELWECQRHLDLARRMIDHRKDVDEENSRSQEQYRSLIARTDFTREINRRPNLPEANLDNLPPKPIHLLKEHPTESRTVLREDRCVRCQIESQKAYARAYRRFKAQHAANSKKLGPLRSRSRISLPTAEMVEVRYQTGSPIQFKVQFDDKAYADPNYEACPTDHCIGSDPILDARLLSPVDIEGANACGIFDFVFPTPESRLWKKYMFQVAGIQIDGPDLSSREEREEWWYAIICNRARGFPWWDQVALPEQSWSNIETYDSFLGYAPLTPEEDHLSRLAAILYVRSVDGNDQDSYNLFQTVCHRIKDLGEAKQGVTRTDDVFCRSPEKLAKQVEIRERRKRRQFGSSARIILPDTDESEDEETLKKTFSRHTWCQRPKWVTEEARTCWYPEPGFIYLGRHEDGDFVGKSPITWSGPGDQKWKVCRKHQEEEGIGACPEACFEPEVYDEAQSTIEITLPSSREPSVQGAGDAKPIANTRNKTPPNGTIPSSRAAQKSRLKIAIPKPDAFLPSRVKPQVKRSSKSIKPDLDWDSSSDEKVSSARDLKQVTSLMRNAGFNVTGSSSMRPVRGSGPTSSSSSSSLERHKYSITSKKSESSGSCSSASTAKASRSSDSPVASLNSPRSLAESSRQAQLAYQALASSEHGKWMTQSSSSSKSVTKSVESSSSERKVAFAQQSGTPVHQRRRTVSNSKCQPWHTRLPKSEVLAGEMGEIKQAVEEGSCWDCAKAEVFERIRMSGPKGVDGSQSRSENGSGNEGGSSGEDQDQAENGYQSGATSRSTSLEMLDA